MALTVGWTVVEVVRRRPGGNGSERVVRLNAGLALGTVGALVIFGVAATTVEPPSVRASAQLGALVNQTVNVGR